MRNNVSSSSEIKSILKAYKRLHRFMSCRIEFLIKLSQISGMFMKRKESFVMFTARLFTSISLVSS